MTVAFKFAHHVLEVKVTHTKHGVLLSVYKEPSLFACHLETKYEIYLHIKSSVIKTDLKKVCKNSKQFIEQIYLFLML